MTPLVYHNHVKALVRWATGKKSTNRLPKLSLLTLPPLERRDIQVQPGCTGRRVTN